MPRSSRRVNGERGTVWLLGPVAVLIVIFLGAIAVDGTALFMARRSLSDAAAEAANDAASAAFDADSFARTGVVTINQDRARQIVRESLALQHGQIPTGTSVGVIFEQTSDPARPVVVHVTLTATDSGVFLRHSTTISATASAAVVVSI